MPGTIPAVSFLIPIKKELRAFIPFYFTSFVLFAPFVVQNMAKSFAIDRHAQGLFERRQAFADFCDGVVAKRDGPVSDGIILQRFRRGLFDDESR